MDMIEKFTAGGVVIEDGNILTLYVPDYNEVVFPKGTIENDESPEQTAIREVLEETGYQTTIIDSLGTNTYEFEEDGKRFRKSVYYFLMKLADKNEEPSPNLQEGEAYENLWLPVEQAADRLTHQENKDLLKQALAKLSLK